MIRVGITGIEGLIGWHLAALLHGLDEAEVIGATRATFDEPARLKAFAGRCDAIVHLAGMNRGDDDEVHDTNVALAQALVEACDAAAVTPHLLFSSSTHIFRETPYGLSKRRCSELLGDWATARGAVFTDLVLPNVFGEGGRPFYNSVVHTFCHQLAHDEPPVVNDPEAVMLLLHAQQVADLVWQEIPGAHTRVLRPEGTAITVGALLQRLQEFDRQYTREGVIPRLEGSLDRDLFNTFRSYLFPEQFPVVPALHTDERGTLFEAVKTTGGAQVFVSTTHPGVTRGNHYHRRKIERFLVVEGSAAIRVRKLLADEVIEFVVNGSRPSYVDIPTLHTHNITNIGDTELTTLFWADEIFDPEAPDTVYEEV